MRIEKTVFVSYRYDASRVWALLVYKELKGHGFDAFNYIADNSSNYVADNRSDKIRRMLDENIKARAHFVVLLTKSDPDFLGKKDEWFRYEIETAIKTGRHIVPLMLDGFDLRSPRYSKKLPGNLSLLKKYRTITLGTEFYEEAVKRLCEWLTAPVEVEIHPVSDATRVETTKHEAVAEGAPNVVRTDLIADAFVESGRQASEADVRIAFFSEAIKVNPDYADAYLQRSLALNEKGDFEAARTDFDEYLKKAPQGRIELAPAKNPGVMQSGYLGGAAAEPATA